MNREVFTDISTPPRSVGVNLHFGLAFAMQPRCNLINVASHQTVSENADRRLPSGSLSVQRHRSGGPIQANMGNGRIGSSISVLSDRCLTPHPYYAVQEIAWVPVGGDRMSFREHAEYLLLGPSKTTRLRHLLSRVLCGVDRLWPLRCLQVGSRIEVGTPGSGFPSSRLV